MYITSDFCKKEYVEWLAHIAYKDKYEERVFLETKTR